MVFGLFGKKKKDEPTHEEIGMWEVVDPAFRDTFVILIDSGEVPKLQLTSYRMALWRGEYDKAREVLRSRIFPTLSASTYELVKNAGSGEGWITWNRLLTSGLVAETNAEQPPDALKVGLTMFKEHPLVEIMFHGPGHVLTAAPTGAGKGQSFIMPNAYRYTGPMVIFDPKGEVYDEVGWTRDLYGKVYKFAPFDRNGDSDCFNPLDLVKDWDDATILADLLVVPGVGGDKFWDDSARDLIRALILFVIKTRDDGLRNIREVLRLLSPSLAETDEFLDEMRASGDENLLDMANGLAQMSDKLRSSIYQVARSHLDAWRSPAIERVTATTTPGFEAAEIFRSSIFEEFMNKTMGSTEASRFDVDAENRAVSRGEAGTIFIIIPPDRIRSYRSVIRVVLGMCLNDAKKVTADPDYKEYRRPFTFIIDELPQLGEMKIIENEVATARSAGIRLWLFIQDLNQLKANYEAWESILANCRMQIFYSTGDLGTAEYVSRRLGRRRDVLGEERPLAEPQELMGQTFQDEALILVQGQKPIRALRPVPFYQHIKTQEDIKHWRQTKFATPRREWKEEEEPKTPTSPDP